MRSHVYVCPPRMALLAAVLALTITSDAIGQPSQDTSADPTFPTMSLGTVTYLQYAVDVQDPERVSAFDVSRGYIQIQAELSRRVSVRITPDLRTNGGPLDGNVVLRLKYGYVDIHSLTPGSWLRVGLQQTPWLDFEESINRYRVQGQMFAERERIVLGSSDFGVGYLSRFADQRVEIHSGLYNGEDFARSEIDRGTSIQGRLTVRPFVGPIHGLRLSAFGSFGSSANTADRRHAIAMASYENARVVATLETVRSTRPIDGVATRSTGISGFVELRRSAVGPAAFVRVERLESVGHARRRAILGLAYWLRFERMRLGFVTSLEDARSTLPLTRARERQLAVQTYVTF